MRFRFNPLDKKTPRAQLQLIITGGIVFVFLLSLIFYLRQHVPQASTGGNVFTLDTGGDLQAAIDAAQLGDTIILQAGATFTGPFILRNKPVGSGMITIQSSDIIQMPTGQRVSPAQAALMPKILAPHSDNALRTEPGAHHYKLSGLEIAPKKNTPPIGGWSWFSYDLVAIGTSGPEQDTASEVPNTILTDRLYVHGIDDATIQAQATSLGTTMDTVYFIKRCLAFNGAGVDLIDSYVADCKAGGYDSQAIGGWNGPGPFRIINNYLEAATENILFGGADPSIPQLVPSDITIQRNTVTKQPSWKSHNIWTVKNLLELKNARRVTIDGNIFEYNWSHAQVGYAILFVPTNQSQTCDWCTVEDIDYTNNTLRHSASAINIGPNSPNVQPPKRITIRNNLFEDIDPTQWIGEGDFLQIAGSADVIVEHNTMLPASSPGRAAVYLYGLQSPNFILRNNILPSNRYGIMGADVGGGLAALNAHAPGWIVSHNALIGEDNTPYYPPNTYFPPSIIEVQFVDITNRNYSLSSDSPYYRAGTDGTDLGVDMAKLLAAQIGGWIPSPYPSVIPTQTPTPQTTPSSTPTNNSACFNVVVEKPAVTTNLLIVVRNTSGGEVTKLKVPYITGNLTVTTASFLSQIINDANTTYSILLKADQHLARKITGNPRFTCLAPPKLVWGDLNGVFDLSTIGDNSIRGADIVDVIRGRIQGVYSSADIVTVVRNRNQNPDGDT